MSMSSVQRPCMVAWERWHLACCRSGPEAHAPRTIPQGSCRHWSTAWPWCAAARCQPWLSGMRQLWEIQPDVVHPRVRAPDIGCEGPPLHKMPAHVVKLRPQQDQVGRIIHGEGVHVPDDLLARLGIPHERLLREKCVKRWQGMSLVPAPPVGHEELPEGVNGVVKIQRRPQEGHQVVPRDLIRPELAQEHRLKVDGDVDLLQQLLHDLPILTREFNIAGTLHLQLP